MSEFSFLRPLALMGLLPIALVAAWLLRRPASLGAWRTAIDPALLSAMAAIGRVPPTRASVTTLFPLAAAACVVIALAGPATERRDAPAFRNLDGVVLAMDVSPSVIEAEMLPGLVTAARTLLLSIGSRPAALVVFSGDAYLAAPLTTDTRQIGFTLSLLEADIIPDKGSRPELALAAAADVLKGAGIIAGDVVMFGDGDGLGPRSIAEADRLAALGAKLWLVGPQEPEAEAITLAERAGGGAFSGAAIGELAKALEGGRTDRLARSEIDLIYRHDLGRMFLIPALFFLALAFRRT